MANKRCPIDYMHKDSMEKCCDEIFGKCGNEELIKIDKPLEETFPEIEEFDEVQEELMSPSVGARQLIIIENASNIVSWTTKVGDFFEKVLKKIVVDNSNTYEFLGSYAFPFKFSLKKSMIKEYKQKKIEFIGDFQYEIYGDRAENVHEYERIISEIKGKKQAYPGKNFVAHIGVLLDEENMGHYGIIFTVGDDVFMFDSMQEYDAKRKQSSSVYSIFFDQVGRDIFQVQKVKTFPGLCLQRTGGFVDEQEAKESKEEYLKRQQNTESQNHFCYFWSIWYFHLTLVYGNPEKALAKIKSDKTDPLVVIKKYVWSILHTMFPSIPSLQKFILDNVKTSSGKSISKKTANFLTKFFMVHFRYIWDDCDTGNFREYAIIDCNLDKIRGFQNVNECVGYSLEKSPYMLPNK